MPRVFPEYYSLYDTDVPNQNSPGYVVKIGFLNELPTIKVVAQYCECYKAEDGARDQSYPGRKKMLSKLNDMESYLATFMSNKDVNPVF